MRAVRAVAPTAGSVETLDAWERHHSEARRDDHLYLGRGVAAMGHRSNANPSASDETSWTDWWSEEAC